MIQPSEKAKNIIQNIDYITLATVDNDGQPWNTPVAGFRFDNDYTFYWASWANNQHSMNIRSNGRVFIVIYDSTPSDSKPSAGVYIQAKASELNDEQEVMQAAKVFADDPYNPSDGREYLGAKPRRIYKAVPQKIWLNTTDAVDGNFVDARIEAQE